MRSREDWGSEEYWQDIEAEYEYIDAEYQSVLNEIEEEKVS